MLDCGYLVHYQETHIKDDGSIDILGECLPTLGFAGFPSAAFKMELAFRLRFTSAVDISEVWLNFDVIDQDGRQVHPMPEIHRSMQLPKQDIPNPTQLMTWPCNFTLSDIRVSAPGVYTVVLRVGDRVLARAPFITEIATRPEK